MRYTLRLLTLQQFQRAAALVCAAEMLRQRAVDGRFGAEPFRIGLWVGASVAPNWYGDAKRHGRAPKRGLRLCHACQTLTRCRGQRNGMMKIASMRTSSTPSM